MAQTANVWGMCTGHTACIMHASNYEVRDTDAEAGRHDDDDRLDKTVEAYEEMMQIELEYEMQASDYACAVEDTSAEADRHDDVDYRMDKTTEAYEEMFQHEMQHQCTN